MIISLKYMRNTREAIMYMMDDFKRNGGIGSLGHVFIFLDVISFCTSSDETGLKVEKDGTLYIYY